jgi:hypothetical protein
VLSGDAVRIIARIGLDGAVGGRMPQSVAVPERAEGGRATENDASGGTGQEVEWRRGTEEERRNIAKDGGSEGEGSAVRRVVMKCWEKAGKQGGGKAKSQEFAGKGGKSGKAEGPESRNAGMAVKAEGTDCSSGGTPVGGEDALTHRARLAACGNVYQGRP